MNLKKILKGKVPDEELEKLPRAFEVIGDVAVVEIPDGMQHRKKEIAEGLKILHPRLKTICVKTGDRGGDFRLPSLEVIWGNGTETEHREFGCRFRVDIREAYFSPRESTERQKIAAMVKPGEKILVMFSGVSPSPIIIAKKQPKVEKIVAVDINPKATEYAIGNVRINRVQEKVIPLTGDVRKVCPELGEKFDRILMPLPKGAHEFLDVALACIKKGGVVHFYHWDRDEDLFTGALDIVKKECKKAGKRFRILDKRNVLPYGPRISKICIDFEVL